MGVIAKIASMFGFGPTRSTYLLGGGSTYASLDDVRKASPSDDVIPLTVTQTRWIQSDIDRAIALADTGDLSMAAQLMRAARSDAVYSGVLSTRTDGLVALPKRFYGMQEAVDALRVGAINPEDTSRSIMEELCPPAEVGAMLADGVELGVAVAELVTVPYRDHKMMVRLPPEFLRYSRQDNCWYYRTIAGFVPITPGDGKWVLHLPGGRVRPWERGIWTAIGRAYVRKDNSEAHSDNWEGKLAHAARVAVAPSGATEEQKLSWFQQVMRWGKNTVFSLTPGYDVKLLESNGRGFESFENTIDRKSREMVIAVAGQTVTTDGGAGFQNSDIHKSIRADLIEATAKGMANTINMQVLPHWFISKYGEDKIDQCVSMYWDVTPPKDRAAEAQSLVTVGQAIDALTSSLSTHDMSLDIRSMLERFGIPTDQDKKVERTIAVTLAPTDIAKVIRVSEARRSQGLGPLGDDRDDRTISELDALAAAAKSQAEQADLAMQDGKDTPQNAEENSASGQPTTD